MSSEGSPPESPSPDDTQEPGSARALLVPPARRRRSSTAFVIGLLTAGIVLGVGAGVLFNRWRSARRAEPPAAPLTAPPPGLPAPEAGLPELVFTTQAQRPQTPPEILEAGAKEVHCFFALPGEDPRAKVTVWWLSAQGDPVPARATVIPEAGSDLRGHIVLKPPAGRTTFDNGLYEIALRVGDQQVVDGSFAVLKGAAELLKRPAGFERYRPEVRNLVVAAVQPKATSRKPCVLPGNTARVVVAFDYAHALSGTALTVQWLYEDGLISQATTEVVIRADQGSGQAWFGRKPPVPLPMGKYGVVISLGEGTPPLAQEWFWIGRQPTARELQPAR